jgi:hypothetical protein
VQKAVYSVFNDEHGCRMQSKIFAGGGLFWMRKANSYHDIDEV